jgi:hypothetical protein
MSLHLKPETEAKLEALAAEYGISADAFVEALIEKEAFDRGAPGGISESSGMVVEEHGLRVYRTGKPAPTSLIDDAIRRTREDRLARISGILP